LCVVFKSIFLFFQFSYPGDTPRRNRWLQTFARWRGCWWSYVVWHQRRRSESSSGISYLLLYCLDKV